VRSTNNSYASLISDIRSVIEVAGVCERVQCECVDIWECDKAWDTLKRIEAILDDYEKKEKTQVSCETCNKKDAAAVAIKTSDAWDVIG
jgi:RPA family protein